jgi:hypothetical protein
MLPADEDGTEEADPAGAPTAGKLVAGALAVCVADGKKVAFWPVKNLPLVPQHDHGKTKNHPQNGAADVVHDGVFLEGVEVTGVTSRVKSERESLGGTGSWPPSHQGPQRTRRRSVR